MVGNICFLFYLKFFKNNFKKQSDIHNFCCRFHPLIQFQHMYIWALSVHKSIPSSRMHKTGCINFKSTEIGTNI